MEFDCNRFFEGYEAAFGALKQRQREGLRSLLSAVQADPDITDIRWFAYMLATVKHECADTWQPIEEYGKGSGRRYGQPVVVTDPEGRAYTNVYYGRGYVQLTWADNYRKMGELLHNRLLYKPELALDPSIAYQIMSLGMRRGSFTGKKLSDYIIGNKCDYINARRIINCLDRAELIAGYAVRLETILRHGRVDVGVDVEVEGAEDLFVVTARALNVRSGPGASNCILAGSPLPGGTVVHELRDSDGWKEVAVEGAVNGVAGITGWVNSKYLRPSMDLHGR